MQDFFLSGLPKSQTSRRPGSGAKKRVRKERREIEERRDDLIHKAVDSFAVRVIIVHGGLRHFLDSPYFHVGGDQASDNPAPEIDHGEDVPERGVGPDVVFDLRGFRDSTFSRRT